ncbi:origin recognition complex subunit 3 N-terminus-domain-containing protein [Scleroderma yunnanense]
MVSDELEDINQTTIYIPYQETDEQNNSYSLFPDRDLPNGYELRLTAYKAAWLKCLTRIQELSRALHAPVVDKVSELVANSYVDVLPGLPYTELPVISVSTNGASSSILEEITSRLEGGDGDALFGDSNNGHLVTHIFSNDCPNIASAMKTLVTSFITRYEEELGSVKRRSGNLLTTMDLNLLQAWFDAFLKTRDTTHLVAILHDFEQFEPAVIQDLFEICSLAIPRLPLVFILSLSSPPSPSYIRMTYPQRTLALLQVQACSLPSSTDVLHEILLKTFFDVDFEPELMTGPAAIDFLLDFFGRHSTSLDGLTTILQLIHMKHFEEPLTVFLYDEQLGSSITGATVLSEPDSFGFLDSLFTRICNSRDVNHARDWRNASIDSLLAAVQSARRAFRTRAKLLRVAFQVLLLIRGFMVSKGYKVDETVPELICGALRGRIQNSMKYLCTMVKKLRKEQLDELLPELNKFFLSLPNDVQVTEEEIISRIDAALSVTTDQAKVVAETLADWLVEYFQQRIVSLEDSPLWDIWYTGSTPFPADLLNPSLRASIFAGLLRPQDFGATNNHDTNKNTNDSEDEDESLIHMPDTSILFQRYLESGKMINVYDWFESFVVVLEAQKRNRQLGGRPSYDESSSAPQTPRTPRTPRTPSRHGRGNKKRQRNIHNDEDVGGEAPQDEREETEQQQENWRLEVQARFIRALHELDYVGFIKHTGRKRDHVLRTVLDVPMTV